MTKKEIEELKAEVKELRKVMRWLVDDNTKLKQHLDVMSGKLTTMVYEHRLDHKKVNEMWVSSG